MPRGVALCCMRKVENYGNPWTHGSSTYPVRDQGQEVQNLLANCMIWTQYLCDEADVLYHEDGVLGESVQGGGLEGQGVATFESTSAATWYKGKEET